MRGKKVERRILPPDSIYNSRLVTRFINKIMMSGKKSTAQRVVYAALEEIEKKGKNPVSIFDAAISNVAPKMEVRPRRVGGASYQVPTEVRGDRKEALAIRWIIAAATSRSTREYKGFAAKLAAELIEAAAGTGAAIKKKEDTLKVAESNRAFSHFRW